VVFDIVSLPFDIFVVIKGAYDVHKYRTGQGTNSDAANQVQDELKEHKENMKIANSFESDWLSLCYFNYKLHSTYSKVTSSVSI